MPLLGRTVGEILEPEAPGLENHRLSERQWEKICSNPDFRVRHFPGRCSYALLLSCFVTSSTFLLPQKGGEPSCLKQDAGLSF